MFVSFRDYLVTYLVSFSDVIRFLWLSVALYRCLSVNIKTARCPQQFVVFTEGGLSSFFRDPSRPKENKCDCPFDVQHLLCNRCNNGS